MINEEYQSSVIQDLKRMISEKNQRINALLEENKQLTKEDDKRVDEIVELKKELRKRWERIEGLNKEKSKLIVLLEEAQSDCRHLVLDLEAAEKKFRDLTNALEFYSDKDNLEKYIRSVERYRPSDPDYRHTEISLHDEVTKIAEEALK